MSNEEKAQPFTDEAMLKLAEKMCDAASRKVLEMEELPSTLVVFGKDGNHHRLPIWQFAEMFQKPPGFILQGLKDKVSNDENAMGVLFMSEGWELKIKHDPKNPDAFKGDADNDAVMADLKKIQAGEMSVSDSQYKQETFICSFEARSGETFLMKQAILRTDEGAKKLGAIEKLRNMSADGRTVNFFSGSNG